MRKRVPVVGVFGGAEGGFEEAVGLRDGVAEERVRGGG